MEVNHQTLNDFVADIRAHSHLPLRRVCGYIYIYGVVLDKVTRHPYNLIDHLPKANVAIIPPNSISLFQPMDKGMTAIINAYYFQRRLRLQCRIWDEIKM
jgi:hypothetical protein